MAEKVVYVTDRSFDAASGVLCRNFFVIGGDQELVFPRGGEEQRHPAIFEAVAPPPARDKASDPRVMRRLSLLVDDCWVVAVIGAVLRKVSRVFNPLVNRIDISPMAPFSAYLRIAVPSVIEHQDLWCDTPRPSDARRRIERRSDYKKAH